jgi:arylsulfatase A-like enzyme
MTMIFAKLPWLRRLFGLLLVAGWLASAGAAAHAAAAAAEAPLNVVFILADDLGWGEASCYGQSKFKTPNIDALASDGMRFTQHYAGAPVCAPSRCVLMTGKHLGHAEVRGNQQAKVTLPQFKEGQFPISDAAQTLAEVFQQAGYATGAMGKWGLGPVGSTGDPNRQGFDLFFGYNCQAVAHSYYPRHLWRNDRKVLVNDHPIKGHHQPVEGEVRLDDWIGETYAPDLMIDEAFKFIDANRDRPFFLYLPFVEPHLAMHPPREMVEKFPEEWDDQPYRGEYGYLPHPRPRAGYAAMIAELDDHVGRIMQKLEEAGVADRTLVIFASDNGATRPNAPDARLNTGGVDVRFFNSNGGLRGFKGSVYEGGIRVPMIARLPGVIPAGQVNDSPSYFADWFPTLCEAAKLSAPANLDGESLWPTLTTGDPLVRQKPMVWVFAEYDGQVAVRLGDYKIVRTNLNTDSPSEWEAYDLARDPGETHDLAAERPDLIEQAVAVLRREAAPNEAFPVNIRELSTAAKE